MLFKLVLLDITDVKSYYLIRPNQPFKFMKEKIINWLKENWFKLAVLIAIFWFLLLLQNGIDVYKGRGSFDIDIDHRGYIENENPFGLPLLK